MRPGTEPHVASPGEAARVTEIFAEAFHRDPVWAWAFPEEGHRYAQHTVFWRFMVDAAIPYGWVWLSGDGGAATLWIPPGCPELPPEDEARLEPTLIELVGAGQAAILMEVFGRFDAAHPEAPPHYYLSLLGTHPDFRGQGIGMDLVADNLDRIDAEGMPAYLESSNPANHERYLRLGFEQRGEFSLPEDGPPVATMWRGAREPA